ncbi:MAG: DUF1345 domain-containing protein [Streptosporangiaceae bacterium]
MSSQASTRDQARAGRKAGVGATVPRAGRTSWRLAICAVAGLVTGVLIAVLDSADYAPSAGWDIAAAAYCLWVWLAIWPMDGAATALRAKAEDPNRALSDVIALTACVASMAAVGIALTGAKSAQGAQVLLLAGLGVITVAVSWFTVHTIFTLRYALLYYSEPEGGVDFHCDDQPCYRDFAYIGLTVGATFQVSDTDLLTTAFRTTVLRQTLLAYLFGAIILGVTVNMIASL